MENRVGKGKCHPELICSWISILCPPVNEEWPINILVSGRYLLGKGVKPHAGVEPKLTGTFHKGMVFP